MIFAQAEEENESESTTTIFSIALLLIFFAGISVALYFVLTEGIDKKGLITLCASLFERINNLLSYRATAAKVHSCLEYQVDPPARPPYEVE